MRNISLNKKRILCLILSFLAAVSLSIAVSMSKPVYAVNEGDAETLVQTLKEQNFTAYYAQAESEEALSVIAERKVEQAILTAGYESYSIEISNVEIDVTAENGGTATFTVSGEVNDYPYETELLVSVEKSDEKVMRLFDSQAAVDDTYTANATKSFVDESATGGKKYLRITSNGTGGEIPFDIWSTKDWENYFLGLNMDKYPVMQISFRRDKLSEGWDYSQQIRFTSTAYGAMKYYSLDLYRAPSAEEITWGKVTINFITGDIQYYNETTGKVIKQNYTNVPDKPWAGVISGLYLNLSRNVPSVQNFDFEYISFFASQEEAEFYPDPVPTKEEKAYITLEKNSEFDVKNINGRSIDLAKQSAVDYIDSLKLKCNYEILNEKYISPQVGIEGKYIFDVAVEDTEKVVTMTATIGEFEEAAVLDFANPNIISQMSSTNASFAIANGKLKMAAINVDYDDGFFIAFNGTATGKTMVGENLPYVKVRYQLTGAEWAPFQAFFWKGSQWYCRVFTVDNGGNVGDQITLIINMAVDNCTDIAVYQINETKNTVVSYPFTGIDGQTEDMSYTGTIASYRFNFARSFGSRTATVDYLGFFSTFEEAKAYVHEPSNVFENLEKYLSVNQLYALWGDAKTQEEAEQTVLSLISDKFGVSGAALKSEFTPATENGKGKLVMEASFKNGNKTQIIKNIVLDIDEKPNDYQIWKFNDQEFVNKLVFGHASATIENDALKMVSTNPNTDDGFYFILDTPADSEAFYLQNYAYMRLRYLRNGVGPGQFYFWNDSSSSSPRQDLGLGRYDGDWYTSIVCFNVKSYDVPYIINMNESTGEIEEVKTLSSYGVSGYNFEGLSQSFRVNFARRRYLDRECLLEYIAFFPTYEEAFNFDAKSEMAKSNAEIRLKGYTGGTISYFEGQTKEVALESIENIFTKKLGTIAKAKVECVSYSAPVKNATNGSATIKVSVYGENDKLLFTTQNITFAISAEQNLNAEKFIFTNPAFIEEIEGSSPTSVNSEYMLLSGTDVNFNWVIAGERQFFVKEKPFVAIKFNATASFVKFAFNGVEYVLNKSISSDNVLALDLITGKIYLNGVESGLDAPNDELDGRAISFGMAFDSESAKIYSAVFTANLSEALNYNGVDVDSNLTEFINGLQSISTTVAYSDGATIEKAIERAEIIVESKLVDGYKLKDISTVEYTVSTDTANGLFKFNASILAGDTYATILATATMSMTINVKPTNPIVWDMTPEFVSKLSAGNATLKSVNGVLQMTTKVHTAEDGFQVVVETPADAEQFYLQDYPFIKIKFKRIGHSGTNCGKMQFYYWNNEHSGAPAKDFSLNNADEEDIWISAIFDMNAGTVDLSDLDNNVFLRTNSAMRDAGAFRGLSNSFRITFSRGITVERYAEIDYIAFFGTREEAEAYNRENYYASYNFNGAEYAEAEEDLSKAPKTIEMGVRAKKDYTLPMVLFSNKTSASNDHIAIETNANGNVQFIYNGAVILTSTATIYNGKWTHVAVTMQNGNAKLYLNGVEEDANTTFVISNDISLKAPIIAGDYTGKNRFVGHVMYARIFNQALSLDQLNSVTFIVDGINMIDASALWDLSSIDKSGKFNDALGDNFMVLKDNYGKKGHEFCGSDYLYTKSNLSTVKTFEWWMKTPEKTAKGEYSIICTKNGGINVKIIDGALKFVYGNQTIFETDALAIFDNVWRHYAITILEDGVKLYVDGGVFGEYNTEIVFVGTEDIYQIGSEGRETGINFVGSLSDVRLWSVQRSAEDISINRYDYLVGNEQGLIANYKLDAIENLTYKDSSTNGFDAAFTSFGWYKIENLPTDYTIVQVSDTQSYMFGQPEIFGQMYQWIADNQQKLNIVQVDHLGDITQDDTDMQWKIASDAHKLIEGKIPYVMVLGNHDYASPYTGIGAEFRDTTNFDEAFPVQRLKEQNAPGYTFGGLFEDSTAANMYTYLQVGEIKYLFLMLEYGPRDEVLDWASEVLNANSDLPCVLLTHCYYDMYGTKSTFNTQRTGGDFKDANEGLDIWNKLVSKHDNVIMVNCGHSQNQLVQAYVDDNDYGNGVVQILSDPSAMITGFPSTQGIIMLMCFTNNGKTMHTYYYSPVYDMYYDTQFEANFDMRMDNFQ